MKDRYLIIDGYNMLGQSEVLSQLAKENLEEARERLLKEIANYSAALADKVICVFDAYEQGGNGSSYEYYGVTVIFTKEKETADSYIERYVYDLYNKHTTHITVVTSDMSEQHAIFGTGAYRTTSREIWREIKENQKDINRTMETFNESTPRMRIPLKKDVLSEFEKLRRGDRKK